MERMPVNTKVNPSRQWGVMVISSVNVERKLSLLGRGGKSCTVACGSVILFELVLSFDVAV